MTPAINAAKRAKIDFTIHEYEHDAKHESYGLEAAEKLGVDTNRVFKTLVVQFDEKLLAVGVIPVNSQLSMKQMAKALGVKKAKMAEPQEVEKSTGYVLGGVSPLGQKKKLKTVIDTSALEFQTMFVSAGRRGLEIEMKPNDLVSLTNGLFSDLVI